MKNKSKKNNFRAYITLIILAAGILITAVTETATAKSLYIIADINADPTPIRAYHIRMDGTLHFQAEYSVPNYGFGAIGLAVDTNSKSLFVTYENSNVIQLINATTMTDIGTTTAPSAIDLAGIRYDHDKGLLYSVGRDTRRLYVYDWDASTATLTLVPGAPFTLREITTAYGIALDEINDLLYVADLSQTIHVYRTSDWSLAESFEVRRTAISIAVDPIRGSLYYGGGWVENYYLTKYNLKLHHYETEVQMGPNFGVMGIGVDLDTGLIFVGTGINNKPGGDSLRVYDPSLNQIDIITDIKNPTGLVVPIEDVSYNPLNLNKNSADGAADEVEYVEIGGTVTYNICFDNINNDYTVNNLSIVDTLPNEVSFIKADGDGIHGHYDPNAHTYRWSYPPLPPGSPRDCLNLVVKVNEDTAPDKIITNYVTIDSDETGPTTVSFDVITKSTRYNPLNLSKEIIGGDIEYSADSTIGHVGPGGTIIYDICFDNINNDYTVNNISIVDTLPSEVSFISADSDGMLGEYDPIAHTYKWSYPSLPPGFPGDCLNLVVQVNEDTAPDKIITNYVTIDSDETGPSNASVDVVTKAIPYNPLNLSKEIIGDNIEYSAESNIWYVGVGDTIIYDICFDNINNDYPVNNISIVDTLPKEVSFIMADGDGTFGQYDPITHTYKWSYSSLPPGFTGDCLTLMVQVKEGIDPDTIITNSVTIDSDETGSTTVIVDVVTNKRPLEAALSILPNMLRRNGSYKSVQAIVGLPQGIGTQDIKEEPLILNPGRIEASSQLILGTADRAEVRAWFNTAQLMNAVPGYGEVKVRVIGKLKSGQTFSGEEIIYITRFTGN
jgi:uncharacterized repeat protein (TIGR01451 family)